MSDEARTGPAIGKSEDDGKAIGSARGSSSSKPIDPCPDTRITARDWRLKQMPGYLNGYDRETEADQHHAYMVGFSDAMRAVAPPGHEPGTAPSPTYPKLSELRQGKPPVFTADLDEPGTAEGTETPDDFDDRLELRGSDYDDDV